MGEDVTGLSVLVPGKDPTVDIVAVHGLGSNGEWAWLSKSERGGPNINWLKESYMLPKELPNARIMTFNYASKWHHDAPKQRRVLCANALLTALDNQRHQEQSTRYRPIIFFGHSFGGIVIEQALVTANIADSPFHYLCACTAGIVFLGSPLRGSKAARWGEYVACMSSLVGGGAQSGILKDLQHESETLQDLLDMFSPWLLRSATPAICCFELFETDYGKKMGGVVHLKSLIVDERSACIDGHRKVAISTDHFKINKFSGPSDPAYRTIMPIIVGMAHKAPEKIQQRLNPRPIVQDDSQIPNIHKECLRSLFLTDPKYDLSKILTTRGQRLPGTCEWILSRQEYATWAVQPTPQVLRLPGSPGVGKTMIATLLVDVLSQRAREDHTILFAYYFCDNKEQDRRSSTSILRGILVQLLRQNPKLFKHLRDDFEVMKDRLRESFGALWDKFALILTDDSVGEIFVLIDALDECIPDSRYEFLQALQTLIEDPLSPTYKLRLVITHRPDISNEIASEILPNIITVDSVSTSTDLSVYIHTKVLRLAQTKKYPNALKEHVKAVLTNKAGGTFLWASLVLADLERLTINSMVRGRLEKLPQTLNEVYNRILDNWNNMGPDYVSVVKTLLQLTVVAGRPLTRPELAIASYFSETDIDENLPHTDLIEEKLNDFDCCLPILYLHIDEKGDTVQFIHQSAKDYLTSDYLKSHPSLRDFFVFSKSANVLFFNSLLRYMMSLSLERNVRFVKIIRRNQILLEEKLAGEDIIEKLAPYAVGQYWRHGMLAAEVLDSFAGLSDLLTAAPELRDFFLLSAGRHGSIETVRTLLDKGADVTRRDVDGTTALHLAVENGHHAVTRLLLTRDDCALLRDVEGNTALHYAVGRLDAVAIGDLARYQNGAMMNLADILGATPLHDAIRATQWLGTPAENVVKQLLTLGSDPYLQTISGRTAFHIAIATNRESVVDILSANCTRPIPTDIGNKVPADIAVDFFYARMIRHLKNSGQNFWLRPDTEETSLPSEQELWDEMQIYLNQLLANPYEPRLNRAGSRIYSLVHDYCTAQKPVEWPSPLMTSSYRGAHLRGEELHVQLKTVLDHYMAEWAMAGQALTGADFVNFYAGVWRRHAAVLKKVRFWFGYLGRHYTKREQDEGKWSVLSPGGMVLAFWTFGFVKHFVPLMNDLTHEKVLVMIEQNLVTQEDVQILYDSLEEVDNGLVRGIDQWDNDGRDKTNAILGVYGKAVPAKATDRAVYELLENRGRFIGKPQEVKPTKGPWTGNSKNAPLLKSPSAGRRLGTGSPEAQ